MASSMSEALDLDTGQERKIPEAVEPPKGHHGRPSSVPFMGGRTRIRQGLTPYLPPPVVRAIANVDPMLEPYVGPEASITVVSTLLLCIVVLQLIKALSGVSRSGKAIADDDDDDPALSALNNADDFGDTVILCGPMWAGKTRIFYHLCHGAADLPTVMSLRANAALLHLENGDKDSTTNNSKPLRALDYPGHSGLQDSLFIDLLHSSLKNNKPARIVLVVDSTQPLTSAADFLYDLLQHAKDMNESKFDIFVACHKRDLSSAKNPRRIKISIRTELEKLIKVRSTEAATAAVEDTTANNHEGPWWKEGESLDLDALKYARLRFEATTCSVGDGIDKLADFCKTGNME